MAQYKAQISANVSRQKALKEERKVAAGDPIKGIPTPFVESFDTAQDQAHAQPAANVYRAFNVLRSKPVGDPPAAPGGNEPYLANTLNLKSITQRLRYSFAQTKPNPSILTERDSEADVANKEAQRTATHLKQHDNAAAAIARITALANASAKGRRKVNIARCVTEFGRHKTDRVLAPRSLGLPAMSRDEKDPEGWVAARTAEAEEQREIEGAKQRGGPDTGSSEVQIAILTAKIRAVAKAQEKTNQDKAGQRALRLLVHRRQKMLKYLWRKERGGPRFQHCIEKLGLTEGTWKGEITV